MDVEEVPTDGADLDGEQAAGDEGTDIWALAQSLRSTMAKSWKMHNQ